MSDLSNIPPIPNENIGDETSKGSPWSMLFTMLLLIAGFLFASVLMLHQALSARARDGAPAIDWSQLVEKGKSLFERPPATAGPANPIKEQKSSPLESIRHVVKSQTTEKVWWPRLKLTGFGKSKDDTEGFAIINGTPIHPGEYIGKVKLEEIRTHDVVVEYKGERKTLTVDQEN